MLSPLIGAGNGHQLLYSAVFFAAAFVVALHPERLTDCLGRVLCPALIALILVLFVSCLVHPVAAHYGTPSADYASLPTLTGILGGYQTMDTLAALNFGAVIALNIRTHGIEDEREVQRGTISAGFVAGLMLLAVYAMLTHAGALSGAAFPGGSTGAGHADQSGARPVRHGRSGAPRGDFHYRLLQHLRRPDFVRRPVFSRPAAAHPLPGCCGVLRADEHAHLQPRSRRHHPPVHPGAERDLSDRNRTHRALVSPACREKRAVWPLAIAFTAAQSICAALPLGPLSAAANALPLASLGFGWLLPACLGLALGMVFPEKRA